VRPPVPYFGGKGTLAPMLVGLLPPHEHYVEPYAGSLAVLLAKPRSRMETVNDLDGHLMTFWRVIRDRLDDLTRVCALTPHSRAEHQAAYDLDGCDDLEVARRVWVQLTQGRAGTRRKTGWRHYVDPAGSSASMPRYLAGYVDRMPPAAERLIGVSLECRPALGLIRSYGKHSDVLLYVDPPYLGSTRLDGEHGAGGATVRLRSRQTYAVEMDDEESHRELADALLACKAAVVLSGYPSPLYDDLYAGWDRIEIPTATGQGGAWQERTEVVWSNRPLRAPDLLDLLAEEATA
jgi:DNA adenine methylase